MTVRTLVFEPFDGTAQIMIEIWPNGAVTVATRRDSSSIWGIKHDPTMDDDGDHLRAPA